MILSHDEAEGLLPEYARASLKDEEKKGVEEHVRRCDTCAETLAVLRAVSESEVPDPGELYWETLPRKIRAAAAEKRRPGFFERYYPLRLLPLAPVLMLVLVAVALAPLLNRKNQRHDPLFRDPLEYSLTEYGDLPDIHPGRLSENLTPGEAELLEAPESTYYREFAELSSGELGRLYKTLSAKDNKGG